MEEESTAEENKLDNEPTVEENKVDNLENDNTLNYKKIFLHIVGQVAVWFYFGYATYHYAFVVQNRSYEDFASFPNDTRCYVHCDMQFCNGYGLLILLLIILYFVILYNLVLKPKKIGQKLQSAQLYAEEWLYTTRQKFKNSIKSLVVALLLIAIGILIYSATKEYPWRLKGLVAPAFFIAVGYLASKSRKDIPWRTVISGLLFQFFLAYIHIRWPAGNKFFHCFGEKVATFLSYTYDGSEFVYGTTIVNEKVFAFAILSVIFFFSFFISICSYLGITQCVVLVLGWILRQILGTTVCESVNAAANTFLGMSESCLLFRPYIKLLTASEIHTIMVSGFSTVSGTVLAAYMSFGASPAHLITSSIMAAPGALALSKLYVPETEESKTKITNLQLEKSEDSSILGAASSGAIQGIEIIMGVIAIIVSFVAFVAFLNGVVNWLGYLVGFDDINFEVIFSKIFIPLVWGMGIPWKDCAKIAEVIARKTFINEFVAFQYLGELIKHDLIDARSAAIATFAICGFANPGALGAFIGTLVTLAPSKQNVVSIVAPKAFVVGCFVCFMSASFAGLLLSEEDTAREYKIFFDKMKHSR